MQNVIGQDWLKTVAGLFYPEICQICGEGRATPDNGFICASCRQEVRFIRRPFCHRCGLPFEGDITTEFECANCRNIAQHFISARSAVVAKGVVLEAIHRYKYQRHLWFEVFLADLLVGAALPELHGQKWDYVVPVPLYPVKEREREFNQAERLAVHLSRASGIPLHQELLRRVRPTVTQTRLTRQQRAANMAEAFAGRDGVKLNGERIVLVDDVFTTGATTNACAKILRSMGSGDIHVWTVARGL